MHLALGVTYASAHDDLCPRCGVFLGVCVEGAAQDVPGDSPSAGLGQGRAGLQGPAGGQCCVCRW